MAKLVTAGGDPQLSDAFGESPSILKITLKDGQSFEQRRDYATGSAKIPLTPAQLQEKFMDCATQTVSADAAKKLFAFVNTIDKQPIVRRVLLARSQGVTAMNDRDGVHSFDRRLFLVSTGALALMNAGSAAAQERGGKPMSVPDKRLRQMLAEFVVGFDLGKAPAEAVAVARTGFIDTVGVAIAGAHEEVSHIAAEMVKLEGSASRCTVIGQSFRASPQLAALANGVAAHAMDYDHSYLRVSRWRR